MFFPAHTTLGCSVTSSLYRTFGAISLLLFSSTMRGQEHTSDTIKECQQLLLWVYLTSVKIKDNWETNSMEHNSLLINEIPRIL